MIQQIHTALLTCEDRPNNQLLRTYGPLAPSELPAFFALLSCVLERWYERVGQFGNPEQINYNGYEDLLGLLSLGFYEVLDEDEPTAAFAARRRLRSLLAKFDTVVVEMAMPFTRPRTIREFYINLSARLNYTYEHIVGGDE